MTRKRCTRFFIVVYVIYKELAFKICITDVPLSPYNFHYSRDLGAINQFFSGHGHIRSLCSKSTYKKNLMTKRKKLRRFLFRYDLCIYWDCFLALLQVKPHWITSSYVRRNPQKTYSSDILKNETMKFIVLQSIV